MNLQKTQIKIVNVPHDEAAFTVQYWRDQFDLLYKQEPTFDRKSLVIFDSYFMLAISKDAIRRVKDGKGGIEATRRVVLALLKLVETKEPQRKESVKLAKRQKLQPACGAI